MIVSVKTLNCHPCKRCPLPFIFAELRLTNNQTVSYQTKKSNGLPPSWSEVFRFPLDNTDPAAALVIEFKESRLFMCDETIGVITLPLAKIAESGGVDDWITVEQNSSGQVQAHIVITDKMPEEPAECAPEPDAGLRPKGTQKIFDDFF